MKILSNVLLGLSMSAQVFCVPLESRQSTITVAQAALNRFVNRLLTEVGTLNTALTGFSNINPTTTLAEFQSDLSSLTTTIEGASSIVSGATGTVSCTAANIGDVTMLITNLGMAQSFVTSLTTTLQTAVSTLGAGNISSIGGSIAALENALGGFNSNLQAYAQSLLPCVNVADPILVQPVQTAAVNAANSFQNLLDQFGVGGVLNGLIVTVIP